jgi:FKBP-type peptidyl-prolyl cis-trans isomerase FkpA/FKBP-type peptidyl-prolyl cis-trans isomerase FklB
MNRITPRLALLAALVTVGCSQKDASEPDTATGAAALETTEQRLSYGIAYGLGERLKADGVPLDVAAFSAGLGDAYDGKEALLSDEEIGQEMQAYQESRAAEREAEQAAAAEENAAAGEAFRAGNATAEGVVTTESGLQYKVLEAGEGPTPGAEDTVEVNYRGMLIDGTEFDSSYARGSSVSFGLNQVIPGWTEGLQLMPVGSTYQFVIPPELAYGAAGAGQQIGPNSTLIFEVELLGIPSQEAAAESPDEASDSGEN